MNNKREQLKDKYWLRFLLATGYSGEELSHDGYFWHWFIKDIVRGYNKMPDKFDIKDNLNIDKYISDTGDTRPGESREV